MGMYSNGRARAHKELAMEVMPDLGPIADATTPKYVGKGNICRVKGILDAFISFGDNEAILAAKVLDATAKETFQTEAGYFMIAAPGDFIKTSVAMRLEITKD